MDLSKCPRCGFDRQARARYCGQCLYDYETALAAPETPGKDGWSPLEIGLAAAALVLVLVLGGIGASMLMGGSSEVALQTTTPQPTQRPVSTPQPSSSGRFSFTIPSIAIPSIAIPSITIRTPAPRDDEGWDEFRRRSERAVREIGLMLGRIQTAFDVGDEAAARAFQADLAAWAAEEAEWVEDHTPAACYEDFYDAWLEYLRAESAAGFDWQDRHEVTLLIGDATYELRLVYCG